MEVEETLSVPKKSFKPANQRIHTAIFYSVLLLLIFVASLPTGFYTWHLHHIDHVQRASTNGTANESVERIPEQLLNNKLNNNTGNFSTILSEVPNCNAPLVLDRFKKCRLPCDWTTMSPLTYKIYYGLMVVGFWLALFATIFSLITWSKIQSLRRFPHVVRFYIIVACILLGCCKMIPLRIGLKKMFCRDTQFWTPIGHTSLYILIQGALCHYFTLVHCLWATCFVGNTYAVVVKDNHTLFDHPILVHIIQSLVCWLVPAIIVASCIYIRYPAPCYSVTFVDFMSAMPSGDRLTYFSVTLPMQLTLGVSLCLLWAITWYLRRSRLDSARHTIRAHDDSQSMLRIERQFTSMTVMILLVLGVVLSISTTIEYRVESLVHLTERYINCLENSSDCQMPDLWTPLFAIIILAPGFLCIAFFFLLFMNKDCRHIWGSCFQRISHITTICFPVNKPGDETSKSRCSSTLTVLTERRLSDYQFRDNITPQLKPRASSTLSLLGDRKPTAVELSTKRSHLSPLVLENRPRSYSTPVRFLTNGNEIETYCVISVPQTENASDEYVCRNFNIEVKIIESSTQGSLADDRTSNDSFQGNLYSENAEAVDSEKSNSQSLTAENNTSDKIDYVNHSSNVELVDDDDNDDGGIVDDDDDAAARKGHFSSSNDFTNVETTSEQNGVVLLHHNESENQVCSFGSKTKAYDVENVQPREVVDNSDHPDASRTESLDSLTTAL